MHLSLSYLGLDPFLIDVGNRVTELVPMAEILVHFCTHALDH